MLPARSRFRHQRSRAIQNRPPAQTTLSAVFVTFCRALRLHSAKPSLSRARLQRRWSSNPGQRSCFRLNAEASGEKARTPAPIASPYGSVYGSLAQFRLQSLSQLRLQCPFTTRFQSLSQLRLQCSFTTRFQSLLQLRLQCSFTTLFSISFTASVTVLLYWSDRCLVLPRPAFRRLVG